MPRSIAALSRACAEAFDLARRSAAAQSSDQSSAEALDAGEDAAGAATVGGDVGVDALLRAVTAPGVVKAIVDHIMRRYCEAREAAAGAR